MLLVMSAASCVNSIKHLRAWCKKTSIICDVIRDAVCINSIKHGRDLMPVRQGDIVLSFGPIVRWVFLCSFHYAPCIVFLLTTGVQCSFLYFNPHRIVPEITVQGLSGENVSLELVDEVVDSVCGQLPGSVQKYTPKVKRKKKKEKSFTEDTELTADSSTLSVKKFNSTSKKKKKKQTFDSLTNGQCNGDHEEAEVSCDVRFSSPALPRQFIML